MKCGTGLMRFQFHKVRLKDGYPLALLHKNARFQFHKVRLKDLFVESHTR